jgi:hypothetical protein
MVPVGASRSLVTSRTIDLSIGFPFFQKHIFRKSASEQYYQYSTVILARHTPGELLDSSSAGGDT